MYLKCKKNEDSLRNILPHKMSEEIGIITQRLEKKIVTKVTITSKDSAYIKQKKAHQNKSFFTFKAKSIYEEKKKQEEGL